MHREAVQRSVGEGVGGVADLGEVALGELGGVDDDGAALRHGVDVRLERRGVHRDQHLRHVAGGGHGVVGEVHLE